jgi:hypothetical protein
VDGEEGGGGTPNHPLRWLFQWWSEIIGKPTGDGGGGCVGPEEGGR